MRKMPLSSVGADMIVRGFSHFDAVIQEHPGAFHGLSVDGNDLPGHDDWLPQQADSEERAEATSGSGKEQYGNRSLSDVTACSTNCQSLISQAHRRPYCLP